MTTRTIPENPQPGERYATLFAGGWYVRRRDSDDSDGVPCFTAVAGPIAEADARLLVFGEKARLALVKCIWLLGRVSDDPLPKDIRAALDNLEVPT